MNHALATIFALGLAVSTATQLRVAGPIGPGECLLAAWLGLVIFHGVLCPGTLTGTPSFSARVVRMWGLYLGSLSVGIMIAQWAGLSSEGDGLRDLLALVFVAALSIVLASVRVEAAVWEHLVKVYLVTVTLCFTALLALAAARVTSPIDPWYFLIRFRGWSENPNQIALMLTALPYIAYWAFQRASTTTWKLWYAACLAVTCIAGMLSLSEALYLAWGSSLGLCLVILLVSYFREPATNPPSAVWKNITFPSILVGAAIAVAIPFALRAVELIATIYAIRGQGAMRIAVWRHGFEAATYSPVFGLGPGSFSGVSGPFQSSEAHNTFIDLLTQAGILGLTAYIIFLVFVGKRFLSTRQPVFIGAFVALLVFSCFHFVLRQPTFWLTLVLMARLVSIPESKQPVLDKRVA